MVASSEKIKIPARQGKATKLEKGQFIRVFNTHGSQVVDTWAFKADDFNELMSMEHTRSAILSLLPKVSRAPVGSARPSSLQRSLQLCKGTSYASYVTYCRLRADCHRLVMYWLQISGGQF